MAGKKTANRRKKTRSLKGKTKSWGSRLSSLAKGFKPGGGPFNKHRSRGGGGAYGTNNVGMTISAAKKLYANQLAAGISLQDAMKHNKAETVRFQDLLDEHNDTKKSTMALTTQQGKLNELYKKNFGRDAGYGEKGGADYWIDTHNPQTQDDWDKIDAMLAGSDEGQKHAGNVSGYNKGQVYVGGIDSTKSIDSQSGTPGFWGDHFKTGGVFENQNAAGAAQAIADNIGFTPQEAYFNNSVGGGSSTPPGTTPPGTTPPPTGSDGWWTKFADADAFKKFLQPDQKSDGMGDFMKFMMLMNVMRPGGQGGYGGGGSQYGYGGLNPGGVQSAYDPMASLTGMGDWFKKNFGSGGSTTATVNTD